jgi:uncharacterized protein (DUF1697 family)
MSPGAKTGVYVAFLRAVNVGGKNRLPMKDLAAMFGGAGCADVVTYIQSGNVVFRATEACAARVPAAVEKAVADRFAFRSPVVVRSAAELRAVARGNPYRKAGADVDALHVLFLAERPNAARVAQLDPHRSPPDEFQVRGREVYFRCPNGVGRSKLTVGYFDSKLGTTSTLRNWRTVLKLVEMAGVA